MPAVLSGQFGRYEILKKVGQGGMGAVYLAEDTNMRRKVALKVPSFEGNESHTDVERFYREARVAADIRHPGVCTVYDVGAIDGVHFLTMAYIEGTPLVDLIQEGSSWPVAHAVAIVMNIADSLYALHQRGIVHRDLKPGNVMIEPSGRPVLLDFGLARSIKSASQMLTASGASLGTPAYMAPEQVEGRPENIGAWTDVYPLGVILFQLLTGRLPFQPATMAELFALLLHGPRPRASQFAPGTPPDLDALCLSMLAVDPRQRPSNMPILMDRLRRCQAPAPVAAAAVGAAPEMVRTVTDTGFSATCPTCHKRVRVTAVMTGKRVVCPGCRGVIPPTQPLAPVVMLDEVPDSTEPIQQRRPTTRHADTAPVRDRTERRAPTGRVPARQPRRPSGGGGWLVIASSAGLILFLGFCVWGMVWMLADAPTTATTVESQPKLTNSLGMELVWIPSGSYTMGAPESEHDKVREYYRNDPKALEIYQTWIDPEKPQHPVEITRGFYLGAYEVTQEQYEKVMGSNPSGFAATGIHQPQKEQVAGLDTHRFPVDKASWYMAGDFCRALSERPEEKAAGRRYRLPTEAEWEYACRAGSTTAYYTGADLNSGQANYDATGYKRPVAVDDPLFKPNAWGLHHMHGNVREWCSDYHDTLYYGTCRDQAIRRDPPGPATGTQRVIRGGCWNSNQPLCRSASRNPGEPGTEYINVGFRVVCEKVP